MSSRSSAPSFRRAPLFIALVSLLAAGCHSAKPMTVADAGWGSYNRSLDGQRYSPLDQITVANVAALKPVCELTLGEEGAFQTGPVVVGDRMFVTTPHTTVALNAATCQVIWRDIDTAGAPDPIAVNRGAAWLDGKLFRGMAGGRLAAFDANSGAKLWDVPVANSQAAEFLSSAPIAYKGMVYIGLAGGDWGIRGRVMGFDAATGKELWRFNTIPMGNEKGAETWRLPETAKRGGGGTWTSYTLDTTTDELFVPVGNPAPDFTPASRPGDNLFTNSVVVLDGRTGALKWWFQATPHDGFDWDVGAAPALYATAAGEGRVAIGSKDGHLYGVDRATHSAVFKTPITTIFNADKVPTPEGVRACPGPLGGVEWNGPAYDPSSGTIYVGTDDWCATYRSGEQEYVQGQIYMGTASAYDSAGAAAGWVYAVNGGDGSVRWKFRAPKPVIAGVTPTAGGLLFTGDLDGTFYAFDKGTGKVLLTVPTSGGIAGGVVTYEVNGVQYVAATSGNVSRLTFNSAGSPKIVVLGLNPPAAGPTHVTLPEVNSKGLVSAQAGNTATERGGQTFVQYCAGCHGIHGEGGVGPSFQAATALKDLAAIEGVIKNPKSPMPALYPKPLGDEDVAAVAAYVKGLQRTGGGGTKRGG